LAVVVMVVLRQAHRAPQTQAAVVAALQVAVITVEQVGLVL